MNVVPKNLLPAGAHALVLAVFVVLLVDVRAAETAEGCLRYEPHVESLRGNLSLRTYDDPTEGTSDKRSVMVVDLQAPICVRSQTPDDINLEERGIRTVQVVYDPKDRKAMHGLLHKRVLLTGALYHAHTAQHLEKILIKVSSVQAVTP